MNNIRLLPKFLFALFTVFFFNGWTFGHSFSIKDIKIDHPYATPTIVGVKNGAVYFKQIINQGKSADQLVFARVENAQHVEIHQMSMDGSIMRMRQVSHVDLMPGLGPVFKHGQSDGYHLMLIQLTAPLKDGDRFPIWLTFKHAGEKKVMVWVQKSGVKAHEPHQH